MLGSSTTTSNGPLDRTTALEQGRTGDYAVHASRIDGDYWEAEAHPL